MTERDAEIVRLEIEKGGADSVVSGAMWGCPLCRTGRYRPSCKFRPIDCLHSADKYIWFSRLTEEKKKALAQEHEKCMGDFDND